MNFSKEALRRIIDMKTIKSFYPFSGDDFINIESEIDEFLKKVVGQLKSLRQIEVEADFEHYGSGFASYVDVFIAKKDGSNSKQVGDTLWKKGISLYLCRLAPVAVYGKNEMTENKNGGGSYGYINENTVDTIPEGNWNEVIAEVINVLEQNQIKVLKKDFIMNSLDFEADISTIFKDNDYKIFDALFYWED